ncbi:helix-turn-helix domain-containing protein [Yinghuangia soli]|uniref:Helix-turn-helix transcriptional regulator n=1 Tax=Yinghuangia soli TaxID=2908204 RepID=A0AA41Q2J7_9ACTN|nr:helix-turn-helix transcriptional regulator [Yinghuangia soli]MCF2530365.1 helix-turn-helix transcriptional regulator [Yinghuangia soli]
MTSPEPPRSHRLDRRAELRDFLRSRRARLRPEDAGLPALGGRRRVPGLRREEVALLAGISTTHYTRLEQGDLASISAEVLAAVGAALRLGGDEREYFGNLVHPAAPRAADPRTSQGTDPLAGAPEPSLDLRALMHGITDFPAFVNGRYGNPLAWNQMTTRLLFDFGAVAPDARTWCHIVFLHEAHRSWYSAEDWTALQRYHAAYLRLGWSRHPEDPRFHAMVDELRCGSADFRTLWDEHTVADARPAQLRFRHPSAGPLHLTQQVLTVTGDRDQTFVTQTATFGSTSHRALRRFAGGDVPFRRPHPWTFVPRPPDYAGTPDHPGTSDCTAAPDYAGAPESAGTQGVGTQA